MIHVAVADVYQTRTFSFTQPEIVVGCDPGADLVLERDGVAPQHVRIALREGAVFVDDLRAGTRSTTPITPDDIVRIAGIELHVSHVPLEPEHVTDATERALLDEIRARPGDPAPRLVYADWLDDHGHIERAEFLRVQLAASTATDPDDPAFRAATERLWQLALEVGLGWRACVAIARIEGCASQPPRRGRRRSNELRMELVCPMRWDQLTPTEHDGIRTCSACRETVTYCTSVEQARPIAQAGGCVAIDVGTLRSEFDLEAPLMVGRPSPPFSRYGR